MTIKDIYHIRMIGSVFVVSKGLSLYTPYTKHFEVYTDDSDKLQSVYAEIKSAYQQGQILDTPYVKSILDSDKRIKRRL